MESAFKHPLVRCLLLAGACWTLAGCTYERLGPTELHYREFKTAAPSGDTVTVCHAYGCKRQSKVTFRPDDIADLGLLMNEVKIEDTPAEERRAIAYAIARMEQKAGRETGTESDRRSMDFTGSGDPTQLDCVDEATNATSYLSVLARNDLLRHHRVERPLAKDNMLLGRWPHWAAIIVENGSGQRYAIDAGVGPNGTNPAILTVESWYIDDRGPIRRPAPVRGYAATDASMPKPSALGFAPKGP